MDNLWYNLFSLEAKAFDAILQSTFMREIGLQFLTSLLLQSFFSMRVTTACFCEALSSPLLNEGFTYKPAQFLKKAYLKLFCHTIITWAFAIIHRWKC